MIIETMTLRYETREWLHTSVWLMLNHVDACSMYQLWNDPGFPLDDTFFCEREEPTEEQARTFAAFLDGQGWLLWQNENGMIEAVKKNVIYEEPAEERLGCERAVVHHTGFWTELKWDFYRSIFAK